MEQEDYLLRQISHLARALGKILFDLIGLKNTGQVSLGIEITNQVLKDELDFDIQELMDIPTNVFINTLSKEKKFCNDSFEKLAEILLLIADSKEGNSKQMLYEKCLTIFEHLEKTENVFTLGRQWKMEQIKLLGNIIY